MKDTLENDLKELRNHFAAINELATKINRRLTVGTLIHKEGSIPQIICIQEIVAHYYQQHPSIMWSKRKTQELVWPRFVAMYITRTLTRYASKEVGAIIRSRSRRGTSRCATGGVPFENRSAFQR
jgi:chromosomal replication initiation ATPase DnaA